MKPENETTNPPVSASYPEERQGAPRCECGAKIEITEQARGGTSYFCSACCRYWDPLIAIASSTSEARRGRERAERAERELEEARRLLTTAGRERDEVLRDIKARKGLVAAAESRAEALAAALREAADHLGRLSELKQRRVSTIREAYAHAQEIVLAVVAAHAGKGEHRG